MGIDEGIHSETRIEYALIPAAIAVVVYGARVAAGSNIGSLDSSVDSSPIQMRREQQSRVSGIQKKLRGGARMNKVLTGFLCVLGLAAACIPAYANPINKKITLSCNVSAGSDFISGTVTTMMLCAPSTPPCTAATFDCLSAPTPPISCDTSSGTISMTVSCDAPWKVGGFFAHINGSSSLGTGDKDIPPVPLGGKGYSVTFITNPGSVNDTITFTVK